MRLSWSMKLATSAVSGSRRYSPQASDQHRKISSVNGSRPADGFQMSWRVSAATDWHISATASAAANISTTPPRLRASATTPMIASVLSTAIVHVMLAGLPKCAGSASSQYSIGPRLYVLLPVTCPA